jgi:predicted lipoprotein with Yx(FWY)xxD motif
MINRASACVVLTLLALPFVAGCGGSDSNSSGSTDTSSAGSSSSKSTETESGPETVKTASTDVGTILVDGEGKTLYLFEKDKGPQSTCSGGCAGEWPPVTTDGKPQAGGGVTASMLATSKRSDGTVQVVYGGHPLYYFSGDSSAGATNGQGLDDFGGEWYVLGANGNKVEGHEASDSGGGGSSNSGY